MAIYSLPPEVDGRRFPELDTDDEAFSSIFRTYRPALLAFCRSRLADASEAEDACQESFLRVYRALPRFDRTQRLWPWLATIAANVCTDMRRKKRAVPLSACDTDPRAGRTTDLNDELEIRARARLVVAALGELPEGQQRQVYLVDAEGWTYADVAASEQRSLASVRTSIMRGRSAFRAKARAIAEDRGMWPLAALPLPLARLRRLLGRTAKDPGLSTSAAPIAIGALQVAAVALVLVGTLVPVTGTIAEATAAVDRADLPAPTSIAVPDRVDHETAAPVAPSPVVLPITPATTDIDLDGDTVAVRAWADVHADPDEDPTVLGVVTLNCADYDGRVCGLLTGG